MNRFWNEDDSDEASDVEMLSLNSIETDSSMELSDALGDDDSHSSVDNELTEGMVFYLFEYSKNLLIRQLFDAKWNEAIVTCRMKPELVQQKLSSYGTPLHCALLAEQFLSHNNAPLALFNELVSAYPEALTTRDFLGDVPLHLACGQSLPQDIFNNIFYRSTKSALIRNFENNLPLHHCWRLYNISAILEKYPSQLNSMDGKGKTIIDTFLDLWRRVTKDLIPYRLIHFEYINDIHICEDTSHTYISALEVWNILLYLFQISASSQTIFQNGYNVPYLRSKSSYEQQEMYPLHSCLKFAGCPFEFIGYAVKLIPEQAKRIDMEGNFPLHLAAQLVSKCLSKWAHRRKVNTTYEESRKSWIDIPQKRWYKVIDIIVRDLVDAYPNATRITNSQGKLPIQLIDASGVKWGAGIMHTISANPSGLHKLNLGDKLWPRVLSKISRSKDIISLQSIFMLLREMPDIFKDKIPPRRSTRKKKDVSYVSTWR